MFPGQQVANVYCHNFIQDRTMHRQVCMMRQLGSAPPIGIISYSLLLLVEAQTHAKPYPTYITVCYTYTIVNVHSRSLASLMSFLLKNVGSQF